MIRDSMLSCKEKIRENPKEKIRVNPFNPFNPYDPYDP